MKNFLRPLKLACLAAASMLIVSCGGSADYRSILPADSFMTVAENLALKNELTHFLTPDRIERLLEAAGIAGKRDTPAGKLSFGQQQRVAFIRCLCQPFDFILLDEPVSHLDAANGEVLSALLLEGAQAQGAGVIVTSVGSRLRLPYHKIFTL